MSSVMNLKFNELKDGSFSAAIENAETDSQRILATAVLIFLNDPKTLPIYMEAAKSYLEGEGQLEEQNAD